MHYVVTEDRLDRLDGRNLRVGIKKLIEIVVGVEKPRRRRR